MPPRATPRGACGSLDQIGHGEAEHRRALDEAGAVALAGEEVVDHRVLGVGCLRAPRLEAPAGLSIRSDTERPNIVARWMKPARSHSPAKRSSTTVFWGSDASARHASRRLRVSR